jgi:Ca-activated chloride channel homolog
LLFSIALPLLVIIHFLSLKYTRRKALNFANFEVMEKLVGKKLMNKNFSLLILRLFTLTFLIFAAAGTTYWYTGQGSSFDYALLIDGSVSMLSEDYEPNRLESAKKAALKFVDAFPGKVRIGLATFTGTTFIKQKITEDKGEIRKAIEKVQIEEIGGTAMGDAMITASNLLFEKEEGNVIILLTDGQSNVGINPQDAINYLNDKSILVYTVGIGTPLGGNFIEGTDAISKLNEEPLKLIASETGGTYFRAEDSEELEKVFSQIAKSKTKRLSQNLTVSFMLIGVSLLLIEWSLLNSKFRSIP